MLKVKRRTIFAYLFPMLITIALINVTPIIYTLYLSFTNNTEFNNAYDIVGLANYFKLLFAANSDLYFVIWQTILYVAVCIALFLIVGLLSALALNNQKVKGLAFFRVALMVPWAAPAAITALIWKFLFNFDFGPLNQITRLVLRQGSSFGINWLNDPFWAFMAVVIVNVWLSYPFFTIVILGALQSIPAELTEAAEVDGATSWQRFFRVTFPLLRPAITPAAILSAITTFQMFTTVWLITQGGPIVSPLKPGATTFVMIYMYNQVLGATAANVHYAQIAAFSITTFIILGAITFISRTIGNKASESREAAKA
jgi:ABC-type sugar transport systems, permease components